MEKRYQYEQKEKEVVEFWKKSGIFEFDRSAPGKIFSVDTPPPTVSGKLHIGHVFSYTHADLISRYKKMTGHNVFYPMGFDDNGLPTERFVEKKRGLKIGKIGRAEFIKQCLEETALARKDFEALWTSLGLSVDWKQAYSTISPEVTKVSQYSFVDLYKKGFVSRKAEPYLFCTTCRTAVSQAELDWKDKPGKFNTIEFKAENGKSLLIATTRPEMLPACAAIFFHPDDNRYKDLEGKTATVPVFGHQVKIIADTAADPEKGTGLVMCCTFGDQTDTAWYKKHDLDFIQAIGIDGKMTERCGPLAGLKVEPAREKVLEILSEQGALKSQEIISHGANVHERCGKSIEYQIVNQWFIKIVDQKDKFLELADQVEWNPAHMKARYIDWVSNLSWDWCISRQRQFGIPFPVWNCTKCPKSVLSEESNLPVDPCTTKPPVDSCSDCGGDLEPETDVMDTWATSALTPLIISGWPDNFDKTLFPNSMRPQAHDIIRTWAFVTIVKTYYHLGVIPWKKIAISGHVLAGREKISKSKNNASNSPEKLIEKFSADAVRFWAAGGKLGVDTLFDEAKLKNGQRTATKLWNAFKFASQNLGELESAPEKPQQLDRLSEWLLQTLQDTQTRYHKYFEKDDYSLALEASEKFFWNDFCDNYLEMVKDVFFNPENYSQEHLASTRFALFTSGLEILKMYAPFMPFVTETIYKELFGRACSDESIHHAQFSLESRFNFKASKEVVDLVVDLVGKVRKLKSENELSLKTEISLLEVNLPSQELVDSLSGQQALIKGVTKATQINFATSESQESVLQKTEESCQIKAYVGFKVDE